MGSGTGSGAERGDAVVLREGDIHLVMAGDAIHCHSSSDDSCLLAVTNNAFE